MTLTENSALLARVEDALDDLRPHLAVDGGNIEVVEITDDLELKIKWLGNCESCTMSAMTMRAGIEQVIKQQVPEITLVHAVNGLS